MRERNKLEKRKKIEDEDRLKNKELLKSGSKPVFMSKTEKKNRELVSQYEELKKRGNLDKYIKKKNKQHATKDRKRLQKAS